MLDRIAYGVGVVVLGLLTLILLCVLVYYAVIWFNRARKEFWYVVDFQLNKEAYRAWLATNPQRDERASDFIDPPAPGGNGGERDADAEGGGR